MITVEEWALIRHLHLAEGISQRRIAEKLGVTPSPLPGFET
ncbi:MAG: helix-turn-helix domain-containing protein [Actinomycetota bacterium]|nr:helix-turn-helix domain-containing protein [Actinomycetota bacterium]